MTAEFGNFSRSLAPNINRNPNHRYKGAAENDRDQPGGNVSDAQSPVKGRNGVDWLRRVQEYFHDPRDHDEDKNENVVAFQTAPDRFELPNLERWQNEIFTDELFPFALQEMPILHHHWDEKMRFE